MTARKVGDHVEMDEEDARSGQTGLGLRYVLAISVLLVLVGFGFAAIFT